MPMALAWGELSLSMIKKWVLDTVFSAKMPQITEKGGLAIAIGVKDV